MSSKRYVYVWADEIHVQAQFEEEAQCILVVLGATPEGRKEIIGFSDGTRESAHDWRALPLDLKQRGLSVAARDCRSRWRAGLLESLGRGLAQNP